MAPPAKRLPQNDEPLQMDGLSSHHLAGVPFPSLQIHLSAPAKLQCKLLGPDVSKKKWQISFISDISGFQSIQCNMMSYTNTHNFHEILPANGLVIIDLVHNCTEEEEFRKIVLVPTISPV
jgi:hypothetical protein